MKIKRLWILLLFLSIFSLNGVQAEVRLGPTIGLNFSYMNWELRGDQVSKKFIVRGQVGLITEIKLHRELYLRHGLLVTEKGAKYLVGTSELLITPLYLEIPMSVVKKVPVDNTKLSFLFLGGVFLDYAIGGTYKYSNWENSQNIKYGSGSQNDMKEIDFGFNCGFGIDFFKFSIIAKYDHGFTNLASENTSNEAMKSRLISVSFAYLFGEKDKKK